MVPGDSFEINFDIGLRAFPMVFPIQTPVTVEVEAYLIPYRILWDDWKDFIFNNKQREHPWLALTADKWRSIKTGSLADYLGVPTTFAGQYGASLSLSLRGHSYYGMLEEDEETPSYDIEDSTHIVPAPDSARRIRKIFSQHFNDSNRRYYSPYCCNIAMETFNDMKPEIARSTGLTNVCYNGLFSKPFQYCPDKLTFNNMRNVADGNYNVFLFPYMEQLDVDGSLQDLDSLRLFPSDSSVSDFAVQLSVVDGCGTINIPSSTVSIFRGLLAQYGKIRLFICEPIGDSISDCVLFTDNTFVSTANYNIDNLPFVGSPIVLHTNENVIGEIPPELNPFLIQPGETEPAIKLSVLSWRAYEAIYNRYKRNNIVNPLRINGEIEYNEYVTTKASGADTKTPLGLRNRNYEFDYLTSCYTSPQQGVAPLVGITPSEDGTKAILHLKDIATQTDYDVSVEADDTGEITGISQYTEGTPTNELLTIENMIKFGISIQTFRSVNALTDWLTVNQRRGFRYEEQMFAHFAQDVSNIELQEPIFLGGRTSMLQVRQLNATAKSDGMNLGDFGGQAYLADSSKHSIRFHSQEHGLVMITLTVCPIPSYSQLLPKLFLKTSPLDYFSEKFQHIGLQPVSYKEVCPIQTFANGDNLDATFGYQRPYYDLISNVDEQHGRMRSDLQNFLVTRTFNNQPLLSQAFVEVKPENLTNPFVDTAPDADNFIGQVYFDITAKRPISRMAIERLEP